MNIKKLILSLFCFLLGFQITSVAQNASSDDLHKAINQKAETIFAQVVEWRRHFHENPN